MNPDTGEKKSRPKTVLTLQTACSEKLCWASGISCKFLKQRQRDSFPLLILKCAVRAPCCNTRLAKTSDPGQLWTIESFQTFPHGVKQYGNIRESGWTIISISFQGF